VKNVRPNFFQRYLDKVKILILQTNDLTFVFIP